MFRKISLLILLLGYSFTTGCGPVLSEAVIKESEPGLTFGALLRNPEAYLGKTVVLGGTILNVTYENTATRLEVLQRPLGYRQKPTLDDRTEGRFLLFQDQLIDDPALLQGRRITVAAQVVGKETRPLDKASYDYPLLKIREYHVWPPDDEPPSVFFGIHLGAHF